MSESERCKVIGRDSYVLEGERSTGKRNEEVTCQKVRGVS
jgi:hypothetical protein